MQLEFVSSSSMALDAKCAVSFGFEKQLRHWLTTSCLPELTSADTEILEAAGSDGVHAVDSVLRCLLWDILDGRCVAQDFDAKTSDRFTHESILLGRLVDVMVVLCEKDLASANLPSTLLTDLFDTITINRCEQLFHLVEKRIDVWKRPKFFTPCKNQMLRVCNDLLRRLSKSHNTVFCGQILIVLAKLFPLSERSGLNIVSEFNTEHLSTLLCDFSAPLDDESIYDDSVLMDIDVNVGDRSNTSDKLTPAVVHNLHKRFWNLQEYFRQPNLCYISEHWNRMSALCQEVLTIFASFRPDERSAATGSLQGDAYFAKYLTSRKLFELELSDSNFRRCILIQFLIMFDYLKATVRFKLDNQVLSAEHDHWVREKTSEIYQLLEQTPPDGKEFARSLQSILQREELWNAWKNDNCPAFKSVGAPERKLVKRKRRIGDDIKEHLAQGQISMGSPDLTRLYNICPDHWEACRGERRNFVPSMKDFFAEAVMQADPAACIEDQWKLIHNPDWGWRALRILSEKCLHFFTSTNQPPKSLPSYLDTMVGYLAKDLNQNAKDSASSNGKDASTPNGTTPTGSNSNSQSTAVQAASGTPQAQLSGDASTSDRRPLSQNAQGSNTVETDFSTRALNDNSTEHAIAEVDECSQDFFVNKRDDSRRRQHVKDNNESEAATTMAVADDGSATESDSGTEDNETSR